MSSTSATTRRSATRRSDSCRDGHATSLVTVTGVAYPRGKPCVAFTEHGFVGMEAKTIKAILSWIRTGDVPGDVFE